MKKLTKWAHKEHGLTPRELWAMPTADILLLYYSEPDKPTPTLQEKSLARGGPPYCASNWFKGCKRSRTR